MAALALATTGFGYQQRGLLSCNGDFGRFANGLLVGRPMQLNFVVDWLTPAVVTDTGRTGRIITLTALELVFEIPYADYTATYRVNRIDGTISQQSSVGGVFHGNCDLASLETKF